MKAKLLRKIRNRWRIQRAPFNKWNVTKRDNTQFIHSSMEYVIYKMTTDVLGMKKGVDLFNKHFDNYRKRQFNK